MSRAAGAVSHPVVLGDPPREVGGVYSLAAKCRRMESVQFTVTV